MLGPSSSDPTKLRNAAVSSENEAIDCGHKLSYARPGLKYRLS